MEQEIIAQPNPSLILKALLLIALLSGGGLEPPIARADSSADQNGTYAIGHTTVVITDASRNSDGSTPVTSAGRPLYVHLWYPTGAWATQHLRYTWNNPVYNSNPGGAIYPRPAGPARAELPGQCVFPSRRGGCAARAREVSASCGDPWSGGRRRQEHARHPGDARQPWLHRGLG